MSLIPIRFVLISFEGPDRYATAGGLGVRVAELARALAAAGHPTHVIFVGDPWARAVESPAPRLTLHRWGQWISKYYPGGVYHGESAKLYDFNDSLPPFVVDRLVGPSIEAGELPVVMAEEWQTAQALCRVSDLLHAAGIRSRALLLWNANNTTGFSRIDWARLGYVATITTVSRYMKHLMWQQGLNPWVIPNGIPARLIGPVEPVAVERLRRSLAKPVVLVKVGRWHPDKRWLMAVETVAALKGQGLDTVLLAFAGVESHQGEVFARARSLGLTVRDVSLDEPSLDALTRVLGERPADLVSVRSFLPLPLLRLLFRAADAVLANSGHEPFGLVGLEAMAAGGVAITGATGEDYAAHLENAIVLETADPDEAAWYIRLLKAEPALRASLVAAGRRTAQRFAWDRVVRQLVGTVEFLAARQGALPAGGSIAPSAAPRARRRTAGAAVEV
jgi:glycosyltransferase involved in cell wall biosynthesis